MRTLIKVPLYVMVETKKQDQVELSKAISQTFFETYNDLMVSKDISEVLIETFDCTLVRIFSEGQMAQEILKKP
jgi:hypothetical protein